MHVHMMNAPCGMNCSVCSAILRKKPICTGCTEAGAKPISCEQCAIKRCAEAGGHDTCGDCPSLPCARLKRLDKRYRSRYGMGMLDNLRFISEQGKEAWDERERIRWTCPSCSSLLSVHSPKCLACGTPNPRYGACDRSTERP